MAKAKKETLQAIVWKEGKLFVAKTVDLELVSQGKTKKEALSNLQEALSLFLEGEKIDFSKATTSKEVEVRQVYA